MNQVEKLGDNHPNFLTDSWNRVDQGIIDVPQTDISVVKFMVKLVEIFFLQNISIFFLERGG